MFGNRYLRTRNDYIGTSIDFGRWCKCAVIGTINPKEVSVNPTDLQSRTVNEMFANDRRSIGFGDHNG